MTIINRAIDTCNTDHEDLEIGHAELNHSFEKEMKNLNDEIELLNLPITDNCPLIDTNLISIHELFQENKNKEKDLRASILGISRGDNLFIPKKHETLKAGDLIYILTDKNHVKRTMSAFGLNEKPIKKIIIAGIINLSII